MKRWLSLCLLFVFAPCVHAASFIVNVGGAQLVFTPQTLNVDVGDTVTFINKGGFHNVTADDGSFTSSFLTHGHAYSHAFTKPGKYPYHCKIHPYMTGTVIVTK